MNKYKIIAKENLELDHHTWTKELDYEIVEKQNFFTLTSNEGELNFVNKKKAAILALFTKAS